MTIKYLFSLISPFLPTLPQDLYLTAFKSQEETNTNPVFRANLRGCEATPDVTISQVMVSVGRWRGSYVVNPGVYYWVALDSFMLILIKYFLTFLFLRTSITSNCLSLEARAETRWKRSSSNATLNSNTLNGWQHSDSLLKVRAIA